MRFIKKCSSPDFFETEKRDFPLNNESPWSSFQNPCKTALKKHLIEEQQGLCIYCECDLSSVIPNTETQRSTHLEHLVPQEKDSTLRFEYQNLSVSCDGKFLSQTRVKEGESCGHRKNKEYDDTWFLNPVLEENISHLFTFDSEDGGIEPTRTRTKDAEKMISILNLDSPYLKVARLNAKEALLECILTTDEENVDLILNLELSEPREFTSFLRSCFL